MIDNLEKYPLEYEQPEDKPRGRGWHGDPAGHAKAGQIGGRHSAKSRRKNKTELINKSKKA